MLWGLAGKRRSVYKRLKIKKRDGFICMKRMWSKRLLAGGLALLAGAGLLILGGCGPKKEPGAIPPRLEIRQYGIPSAVVDYEVRGLKTGKERLYFDSWGTRQARYIHTRMLIIGLLQEENILEITDGRWRYTIDLPKATAIRQPNPLVQTYAGKIRRDGRLLLGDEVIRNMGGRKAGTNSILGRSCQVWVVPAKHTSYCLWKHLPLLTVMRDGSVELITRAVAIKENVPVNQDIFKIPASVNITDAAPAK